MIKQQTNLPSKQTIGVVTILYFLAFVVLGALDGITGPTIPAMAELTGVSLSRISSLFAISAVGFLTGSLVVGRFFDQGAGHRLLALALAIAAIAAVALPSMSVLIGLAVVQFVLGFMKATLDVGGNTLLLWRYRDGVGPYLNALHFFFGAGAFLAPLIVAQFVGQRSPLFAYYVIALLAAPLAIFVLMQPSPAVPARVQDKESAENIRWGIVALLVIFCLLYVGAEITFGGWVFTYATRLELTNDAGAAYLTSGFWGAFTAARLLWIPIVARQEPAALLRQNLSLAAFVMLILVFVTPSLTGLWVVTILYGIGLAPVFPTMLTLAEQRLGTTGAVTGYLFAGGSVGAMIMPWIVGQFFGRGDFQILPLACVIALFLAGAIVMWVERTVAPKDDRDA